MSYFSFVQQAAGMGGNYYWVVLGSLVVAGLLLLLLPSTARRLQISVALIVISFLGMLACGGMLARGVATNQAGYRWLHFVSQWLLAIALINLAGVLIFRVLLVLLRLQAPPILRDTLLGIAYIVVAISLLGRHDVNLGGIIATSAVVTAVIGFSLQDTLGNIMGGVALQMERSITVGDWVRIGDIEGLVHEIRWRQTSIETRNWDTVVIPNSQLMKNQVVVLGRRAGQPRQHRESVPFTVDFRHTPSAVIDTVNAALRLEPIPNVATTPPPDCVLMSFNPSDCGYAVRYWLTDIARDTPTSSEVRMRIFVALRRAGMSIAIPAQSVFLTLESRSREQRKQAEELEQRIEALKHVAILAPLTDDERREIAAQLTVAPFRKGEIMTRQGNIAHHLYIMTQGEAEVRIDTGNGSSRLVGQIHTGDVFGEMGLMTGEPRIATVVATTDALCYKLDRASFAEAVQRRPELAEQISHLLARRKIELDAAKAGLAAEMTSQHLSDTQGDLLRRIRDFFRLE